MISDRKQEHLELAVTDNAQGRGSPGWEDVHLIPATLPETNLDRVDTQGELAGRALRAPFVISSMTGGHKAAVEINRRLATVADELGIAVGSGSQRAALRDPSLVPTFRVLREAAPDATIIANIGVCQLVRQGDETALDRDDVRTIVEMLDAQFLAVHLNVVEELIQPEGDRKMVGLLDALAAVVEWSPVPVIAKETGAGIAREAASTLVGLGISAIDVGGAGGTSFARVEGMRAANRGEARGTRLGETFGEWGIPTAVAILEARDTDIPIIATGGMRTGLDAAKALALGATAVGMGKPALVAASSGMGALRTEMELLIEELRVAMVLTGSSDLKQLRQPTPVLTGRVGDWGRQRRLIP